MNQFELLQKTAQALIYKKKIPRHTQRFFTDITALKQALHATMIDPIKEYSCTECGISIRGPKKWMIQHHKMHSMKARDSEKVKEDTHFQMDYKTYYG